MLFQLFNFDLFARAYFNRNPKYDLFLAAMESTLRVAKNTGEKIRLWRQNIGRLSAGLACPNIDGLGSSVPPGIASILNMILSNLTRPDFRQRTSDLERVRRHIWSAIRSIENEKEYQRRLKVVRERRRRREEKLRIREQRFLRMQKGR